MSGQFTAAIRVTLFVLLTLPLMPLQALLILLWPAMAKTLPHIYHRLLCIILGFRFKVSGQLPQHGPCLIVSNHVSWIDIVVLSTVAPLSFVAKKEVATWPLFGWMAKLQRTVFVDRNRKLSTRTSRSELEIRLAKGDHLVLFPEGTSNNGANVLPFKSSFFAAATAPNIAIVPVTLAYTHSHNLRLTRRNRNLFAWYADMDLLPHIWSALQAVPLSVEIIIHKPLDVETGRNRKLAAEVTERTIRQTLARALHGRLNLE